MNDRPQLPLRFLLPFNGVTSRRIVPHDRGAFYVRRTGKLLFASVTRFALVGIKSSNRLDYNIYDFTAGPHCFSWWTTAGVHGSPPGETCQKARRENVRVKKARICTTKDSILSRNCRPTQTLLSNLYRRSWRTGVDGYVVSCATAKPTTTAKCKWPLLAAGCVTDLQSNREYLTFLSCKSEFLFVSGKYECFVL